MRERDMNVNESGRSGGRDQHRDQDRDRLDEEVQESLEQMERQDEGMIGQTGENRNVSGSSTYETLPDQGGRELGRGEGGEDRANR